MVESTFKVTLPIELKKLLEEVGTSVASAECLAYLPEDARLNLIAGVLLERKAMSIVKLRESSNNYWHGHKDEIAATKAPEIKAAPKTESKAAPKVSAKEKKDQQFKLTFVAGESQLAFLRRQIPEYLKAHGDSVASDISKVMLGSDQPNHLTQTYTALKHLTKDGTIVRDNSGTTYVYRLPQ